MDSDDESPSTTSNDFGTTPSNGITTFTIIIVVILTIIITFIITYVFYYIYTRYYIPE